MQSGFDQNKARIFFGMENRENKSWAENFYIICCEGYILWNKWKAGLCMLNSKCSGGFRKLGRHPGAVSIETGSVSPDLGVSSWISFRQMPDSLIKLYRPQVEIRRSGWIRNMQMLSRHFRNNCQESSICMEGIGLCDSRL